MTIAMQNYLELIYELSLDGKKARVSDIAKQLGVSKPSVNNAVVVLAKDGYVDYEKYADIKLTDKVEKLQSLFVVNIKQLSSCLLRY